MEGAGEVGLGAGLEREKGRREPDDEADLGRLIGSAEVWYGWYGIHAHAMLVKSISRR